MTLTLDIKGDFTPQEVSEVIRAALEQNERVAKYKIKKYSDICGNFENKYGMSPTFLWRNSTPATLEMTKTFSTGMRQKGDLISGIKG